MKSRPTFRGILSALVCLVCAGSARADGPGIFDVRTFGAKGDGRTADTAAINAAIAAASRAGGGTVSFPTGTFVSGSIHLRSDITLYLGAGATIEASADAAAYDTPEPNAWGDTLHYQDFGHSHWHDSLIWGEGLENIAITGPGCIHGLGLSRGYGEGDAPQKIGNKAIALKHCRHVTLRDFTISHGGWFALLATGVDNLTIDNLLVDTNRDGFDLDCCVNVRVANCSVNSPYDDGICLKSCFGLGYARPTENVTITNCLVSGYDEGTLLDGTRLRNDRHPQCPTGRIKFGTESNGGFKNITINNCTFDYCRGFALESVDGALLEDVTISNITMRDITNAPIFLRLGARMRGPEGVSPGQVRRVKFSHIVAHNVSAKQGIMIAGLPGHAIEDVSLSDILIDFQGGGTAESAGREIPELAKDYPEPGTFGIMPAWGVFARHVTGLQLHDIELRTMQPDRRPAAYFEDASGVALHQAHLRATPGTPAIVLKDVTDFSTHDCPGIPDSRREGKTADARL
jgi:polygalacturonase